jgi:hypothetical protein
MHIQARAKPSKSPPDLAEFLGVLAGVDPGVERINIEGVTGSAVESGGHFVFAVTHGREWDAHDRLTDAEYTCEWTDNLYAEKIPPDGASDEEPDPNQPGVLHGIVVRAKRPNTDNKEPISEVLLGAFTNQPGRFFAQVTFDGTVWQNEPPTGRPDVSD